MRCSLTRANHNYWNSRIFGKTKTGLFNKNRNINRCTFFWYLMPQPSGAHTFVVSIICCCKIHYHSSDMNSFWMDLFFLEKKKCEKNFYCNFPFFFTLGEEEMEYMRGLSRGIISTKWSKGRSIEGNSFSNSRTIRWYSFTYLP